ncbi:hypothetical protein AALO_G00014980 [Alosa alosa]|uniref:THAP-type domain-containing protein n=1 Tax=Alosa alosa TaxID=278164 RepID=A0AAV6HJ90_9TELE|nr:uncharacterized protein LOC125300624 [Alosa alosa]KAG5286449.1 hypothetical protein AALO_G00014980 [Alosa alosa]
MPKRSAYGTCHSDTRYPERLEGGVCFFPFPKPKTQHERCLQWIKLCGRPHSQLNPTKTNKNTYICSKHFVNGRPTPDYPNPVSIATPGQTRDLGGCRKPPAKRWKSDGQSSISLTTDEEEENNASDKENLQSPESEHQDTLEQQEQLERVKKLEEENEKLREKLDLKEKEIVRLTVHVHTLRNKMVTPELLQDNHSPKMFQNSTGFTYDRFNQLIKPYLAFQKILCAVYRKVP